MRAIMEFKDYWWENVKLATEWREMIALILSFLVCFLAFVLRDAHDATAFDRAMGIVERLSLGFAFLIFFTWVPFRRHQNEERIRAKTVKTVADKIQAINEAPITAKKANEKQLGNWILAIQNLRDSIAQIKPFKYDDEIVAQKNVEINQMVEQIFEFLDSKISRGEAATFIGIRPEPLRLKHGETVMVQIENAGIKREGHLKHLNALISALQTIHRDYIGR